MHPPTEPSPVAMAQEPGPPPAAAAPTPPLALLFTFLALMVWWTRWPLLPPQLYSFDTVNLALALHDFDPTRNQPQPPGYPLFVLEARALYPLAGSPELTFEILQIMVSALAIGLLYLLGRAMISGPVGGIAAALLLVNPIFWFSGITSPLRLHLALFSVLVAYFCWRALSGDRWSFYAACVALAVGAGFRPELGVILLPLWFWAGWRCGGWRLLGKGALLGAGLSWIWLSNLAVACGGFAPMIQAFRDYANSQTFQTAAFWAGPSVGWRHMAGRVFVWTSLGALPWIWALPFGWRQRHHWPQWGKGLVFLAVWMLPSLAFYISVHSADPDHILSVVPIVCLIGAYCLTAAEDALRMRWSWRKVGRRWVLWIWSAGFLLLILLFPSQRFLGPGIAMWGAVVFSLLFLAPGGLGELRGAFVSLALLGNSMLFLGQFPFPQGPSGGAFRGLASVKDAYLGGIYESSYNRVRWVSEMTVFTTDNLPRVMSTAPGPVVLIWSRDGEPAWRKLAYYFPWAKIYVLDQSGDPGIPFSQARMWSGNKILARYSGEEPIRLPVPKGGRLVWFVAGGKISALAQTLAIRKSLSFAYTDLPADAPPFRWGSFEFIPQ